MKKRNNNVYLKDTPLLDFHNPSIQKVVEARKWNTLDEKSKIKETYTFVRDEIPFGFNRDDVISASEVLKDGYGQCNTKSTLLMALLRAVDIPCRLHGFTIDKKLQKGVLSGVWYVLAPKNIVHTWVEVNYKDKWYNLEGVILDQEYLSALQHKFQNQNNAFCGYGVCIDNFQNPDIDWNKNNTYIQKSGITQDFGLFNDPDELYQKHTQELSSIKRLIFTYVTRKNINNNINTIRKLYSK